MRPSAPRSSILKYGLSCASRTLTVSGMPGQALAYMTGRLEIVRLREQAQDRLGSRFDVRGFHDVVLGSGSVPLTQLADEVDRWTSARPVR